MGCGAISWSGGRVYVVVDLLIVVTLILLVAAVVVWPSIGGNVFIIICPVFRLEEGALISVSNVETFWIAARETIDVIDNIL